MIKACIIAGAIWHSAPAQMSVVMPCMNNATVIYKEAVVKIPPPKFQERIQETESTVETEAPVTPAVRSFKPPKKLRSRSRKVFSAKKKYRKHRTRPTQKRRVVHLKKKAWKLW
jgi:hypothetical protein